MALHLVQDSAITMNTRRKKKSRPKMPYQIKVEGSEDAEEDIIEEDVQMEQKLGDDFVIDHNKPIGRTITQFLSKTSR